MFLSYKYRPVLELKFNKFINNFVFAKNMTICHWMRLGLLCRTLVRRNFHLCPGPVLEQNRLSCVCSGCFGARQILMRVQDMCKYIHKIVVHARESCACARIFVLLTCSIWRILQKVKLFILKSGRKPVSGGLERHKEQY